MNRNNNNNIHYIGISGIAGVGKSSVAGEMVAILEAQGITAARKSFATTLKKMIKVFTDDLVDKDLGKKDYVYEDKNMRHLYQTLGTQWGRECVADDIWVHIAYELIRKEYGDATEPVYIIFDDVRFDNEVEAIKESGGHFFRLKRESVEKIAESQHISEMGINYTKNPAINIENVQGDLNGTATLILNTVRDGADILPIDSGECEFNNVEE